MGTKTKTEGVKPHCENCGREVDPWTEAPDGYTNCCNELVCRGGDQDRFGVPSNYRVACCWAKAEALFGGPDKVPEGSYRL